MIAPSRRLPPAPVERIVEAALREDEPELFVHTLDGRTLRRPRAPPTSEDSPLSSNRGE